MINPSFQDLEKVSKSRYEISVLLMKRARLLVAGSKALVESEGKKPVTIALDEFMQGAVKKKPDNGEAEKKEKAEIEEETRSEIREGTIQKEKTSDQDQIQEDPAEEEEQQEEEIEAEEEETSVEDDAAESEEDA